MARIVLVGSEGEVRGAISAMLAEQKIAVTTANDLADAIARVTALDEPPDLVLLDRALAGGRERCLRRQAGAGDRPGDLRVTWKTGPRRGHPSGMDRGGPAGTALRASEQP